MTAKKYDDLTLEEKADFIAECISLGLYDYFDNCEKEGDKYCYFSAEANEEIFLTPAQLVTDTEAESLEELRELWEVRNDD